MRAVFPTLLLLLLFLSGPVSAGGIELVEEAKAAQQAGELNKAVTLWGEAAAAFEQEQKLDLKALSLFFQGQLLYQLKSYQPARQSLEASLAAFEGAGRNDGVALAALQLGDLYIALKDFAASEKVLGRGLSAARDKDKPDPKREAEILEKLAALLDMQHRWPEALDYYTQLVSRYTASEQFAELREAQLTRASIYQMLHKPGEAETIYLSLIQDFRQLSDEAKLVDVLGRLAKLYLSLEKFQQAEERYVEVAALRQKLGEDHLAAAGLANLGYAQEKQSKVREAVASYTRAVEIFQRLGEQGQLDTVTSQIVRLHFESGDTEAALAQFQKWYGTPESVPAERRLTAGRLAAEIGQEQLAQRYFEAALTHYRQNGDQDQERKLLNQLGIDALHRGAYQQAVELFEQSLALCEKASKAQGSAFNNLGEAYQQLGDFPRAQEYYRRARDVFEEVQDAPGLTYALANLGTVMLDRGYFQQGLLHLRQALRLARHPDTFGKPAVIEGTILNSLGLVHEFLGQTQQAEDFYTRALAVRRAMNDPRGEMVTLNNLGAMCDDLGRFSEAIDYYSKSLELAEDENPGLETTLMNNLGQAYTHTGERSKALDYYSRALDLSRRLGRRNDEAITLSNLASFVRRSDPANAEKYLGMALEVFRENGNRQSEAFSSVELGALMKENGRRQEAITQLMRAVDLLEELTEGLSPNSRSGYLGRNVRAYRLLIELLLEEGKTERAFSYSERAKAQAFLQMLGGRRIRIKDAPTELLEREATLQRRIRELQSQRGADRETLAALKSRYQQLLDEIREVNQEAASLRTVRVAELQQLQKALGPGQLLLEYKLFEEEAYLFVVDAKSIKGLRLELVPEDFLKRLARLRRMLARAGSPGPVEEALRELSEVLLGPVSAELESAKQLVVVPDGAMHYLPFAALDFKGQPLIAAAEIEIAPSASSWLLARGKAAGADGRAGFALGNSQVNWLEKAEVAVPESMRSLTFSPLPGTIEELRTLKELFPSTQSATEDQMTMAAVARMARHSGLVHLATHGVLDAKFPLFCGLVASDGLIAVSDIFDWDLDAELVVLSACNTAVGGEVGNGGDVVGLTRAFQYAGSKAVVATLWAVSDRSTSIWMQHFYKALKQDATVAGAARQATLMLRQDFPHPFHWAPFVVFGDGSVAVHSAGAMHSK